MPDQTPDKPRGGAKQPAPKKTTLKKKPKGAKK